MHAKSAEAGEYADLREGTDAQSVYLWEVGAIGRCASGFPHGSRWFAGEFRVRTDFLTRKC